MARFAVLLRGVNVGPTTKVPMPELRELLEELGGTDVVTLLNSGNAIVQIHMSPKTADAELSKAVSERFGFQVDVVTRTKKQLEPVLALDPFGKAVTDESRSFVAFMPKAPTPTPAQMRPILETEYPNGELCAWKGREFYVWSPEGVSKSQSIVALAKAKVVPFTTVRNVRTLRKIIDAF